MIHSSKQNSDCSDQSCVACSTIDLEHKIINGQFHDVTTNYEQFAAMKIGYTDLKVGVIYSCDFGGKRPLVFMYEGCFKTIKHHDLYMYQRIAEPYTSMQLLIGHLTRLKCNRASASTLENIR